MDKSQPQFHGPTSLPEFVKADADGTLLAVKVQPRAARNEICQPLGGELRVRVTAPPVDAAANEALVRFLAEVLDCRRAQLALARGHASRHKLIKVAGLRPDTVLARLTAAWQ